MAKKNLNLFWVLIPCLLCMGVSIQAQANYDQVFLQFSQYSPDQWNRIYYRVNSDDIIILGIPSYYDSDPIIPRVSLSEPDSYGERILNYHFDEWQYQDGMHEEENCGLLKVKQGLHTFDGVKFEANSVWLNQNWGTITIEHDFSQPPIVLAQCVTNNESDAVVIRIRNVTNTSFQMRLQEEEGSPDQGIHTSEEIHYILVEQNPNAFIINDVNHNWTALPSIPDNKLDASILFGAIQTTNGNDPCALRYSMDLPEKYKIQLQEETSADDETSHIGESVGIYQVVKPSLLGDINFTGGNPDVRDAREVLRYILGTSKRTYLGEYYEHGDVYRDARNTLHDALVMIQFYVGLLNGPLPITPTVRPVIVPEPGDGQTTLTTTCSTVNHGETFTVELHLQSKTQEFAAGEFEIIYDPTQIIPVPESNEDLVKSYQQIYTSSADSPGKIKIISIEVNNSKSQDLHLFDIKWRVLPQAQDSIEISVNPKTLIDSQIYDLVNKQGSSITLNIQGSSFNIQPSYINFNTNLLTNQIQNSLNIKNNSNSPILLDKLKVRYYYTKDGIESEIMNIDYAAIGSQNITTSFADGYYELGFKPGLAPLAPGQETGSIQCRLHKINWTQYDQSNDYSFANSYGGPNDKITVYYDGCLVSGIPPAN